MRFLVDMPLSPRMAGFLTGLDHDAVHASDLGLAHAPDVQILHIAREEDRIIVTADLDFPQLLALSGADGPGVILFRGGTYSEADASRLIERLLDSDYVSMLRSAITVVERDRIRLTRLPLQRD